MLKYIQISESEIEIIEKLDNIIPNILPDSIFNYNFNISNSPLHKQFFDKFDEIYKSFEITFNTLIQSLFTTNTLLKQFICGAISNKLYYIL